MYVIKAAGGGDFHLWYLILLRLYLPHYHKVYIDILFGTPAEFNNDSQSYKDIDCEAAHKIYSKH